MLVSQRTRLLNGLRGHLTEIGVIAAQGPRHARELARYDRMFELIDCHGEHVERPEEFRPANQQRPTIKGRPAPLRLSGTTAGKVASRRGGEPLGSPAAAIGLGGYDG
jgi:hypothetical protein